MIDIGYAYVAVDADDVVVASCVVDTIGCLILMMPRLWLCVLL